MSDLRPGFVGCIRVGSHRPQNNPHNGDTCTVTSLPAFVVVDRRRGGKPTVVHLSRDATTGRAACVIAWCGAHIYRPILMTDDGGGRRCAACEVAAARKHRVRT